MIKYVEKFIVNKEKRLQTLKRVILLILIGCWIFMIYTMSAKNGTQSAGMSKKIADYLEINMGLKNFIQYDRLHFIIRKIAHFTEYGVLSVLSIGFLLTFEDIKKSILSRKKRSYIYLSVILFCFVNAALDEYHQSFVADREPAVRDVIIDSFGALFFLFIFIKIYTKLSTKKRGNVHN